jgi:hypothetical protein
MHGIARRYEFDHILVYLIKFNDDTGLFTARSQSSPFVIGEGKSLYAALDDLEKNTGREITRPEKFNVNLSYQEKNKDQLELTAKVSIIV